MKEIVSRVKVWTVWRKNKLAPVFRPRRGKIRIDDKVSRRRRSSLKKIAVSAVPAVILVLFPAYASALDVAAATHMSGNSNPARIAAIMACAGGITLFMLIRRRSV
jgi:hypothetical protein